MRGLVARVAALCAVLLVVGGGAAYATSFSVFGSSGTISACVQRLSGEVRLTGGMFRRCNPRTEASVAWNQTGVAGRSIVATTADCDGNGGFSLAYDDGTPIGTLCNGAAGAKGDTGTIVGTACTYPDASTGTVEETVGDTGAISFTCHKDSSGGGGGGTPSAEVCNGIDDDLDGITDDNLTDTPSPEPNASFVCSGGAWHMTCVPPYGDADGEWGDGCEANLDTDPHNCGTVGNDITALPNVAAVACVNGQAVIQACSPGYQDVDGNPSDGCEYYSGGAPAPKTAPSRHERQRPA